MSALTLPCGATVVARRLLAGEPVDAAASGLSAREWRVATMLSLADIGASTLAPITGALA